MHSCPTTGLARPRIGQVLRHRFCALHQPGDGRGPGDDARGNGHGGPRAIGGARGQTVTERAFGEYVMRDVLR